MRDRKARLLMKDREKTKTENKKKENKRKG
jgi:hypothetical protein